jgi:hypothetical protein
MRSGLLPGGDDAVEALPSVVSSYGAVFRLGPAEVLLAIAAFGELVADVFARRGVANEDGDEWRVHVSSRNNWENRSAKLTQKSVTGEHGDCLQEFKIGGAGRDRTDA